MKLKTPAFWYPSKGNERHQSIWAILLWPLSILYYCGYSIRQSLAKPYRSRIPVICVGNLTAGGSGKTPAAIALMTLIQEHKLAQKPVFVTRGYGGDEQLILKRYAPVIVNKDRIAAAKDAEQQGYDLIVMDDGYQNPSLRKNMNILVIDGHMRHGNGHLLPAGPIRQPVKSGLARADLIVLIHGPDDFIPEANAPVTHASLELRSEIPASETPFVAFTGLGYPQKFFTFLRQKGFNLIKEIAFPDHYHYKTADLTTLQKQAKERGARLITTEKDEVKLTPLMPDHDIYIAKLALKFMNENEVLEYIKSKMRSK